MPRKMLLYPAFSSGSMGGGEIQKTRSVDALVFCAAGAVGGGESISGIWDTEERGALGEWNSSPFSCSLSAIVQSGGVSTRQ